MINEALRIGQEIILSGKIEISAEVRDVTESEWRQLHIWRNFLQVAETADIQIVVFDAGGKHDPSLVNLLQSARSSLEGQAPAILYLHRGHQVDTRSPVLQNLLNLLKVNRNVFSLRVENATSRHDALTLASALLQRYNHLLVLDDEVERVIRSSQVQISLSLSYLLLASVSERIGSIDQPLAAEPAGLVKLPGSPMAACL